MLILDGGFEKLCHNLQFVTMSLYSGLNSDCGNSAWRFSASFKMLLLLHIANNVKVPERVGMVLLMK